jgi:hypothetical protein
MFGSGSVSCLIVFIDLLQDGLQILGAEIILFYKEGHQALEGALKITIDQVGESLLAVIGLFDQGKIDVGSTLLAIIDKALGLQDTHYGGDRIIGGVWFGISRKYAGHIALSYFPEDLHNLLFSLGQLLHHFDFEFKYKLII